LFTTLLHARNLAPYDPSCGRTRLRTWQHNSSCSAPGVGPDADTRKIKGVRDPLCLPERNLACEIESQKAVAGVHAGNPQSWHLDHDAPQGPTGLPHRHDHEGARASASPDPVDTRQLDALAYRRLSRQSPSEAEGLERMVAAAHRGLENGFDRHPGAAKVPK
jgi:hypothetical protein